MFTTSTVRTMGFTRSDRFSGKAGIAELTNDDLRERAPSVFADSAWGNMSQRYKFVPTIEVVDWLREEGFLPVRALQSRSRIEGKSEFTKHMVRFRHKEHMDNAVNHVGQEYPEITLVNSHDGTSSYQLYPSIFRAVCLNGLIVHSQDLDGISVRHKGGSDFHNEIIDASYRIISETPQVMAQIEEFKQIQLTPPQRTAMATAALTLQSSDTLKPIDILRTRRTADDAGTVWTTFNTIQENMIKGGITTRNPETRRRSTTKGINSVSGDVATNRALWVLASEMAKIVS
jgi:hypothetical protein